MGLRLLPLLMLAAPAKAQNLVCDPAFFCSDQLCYAAPGNDGEAADYVEDAMGAAPQLYIGDGIWVEAQRVVSQGTVTWTGTSPQGEAVMLAAEPESGSYTMIRREPGAGGRVWFASGECELRP